MVIHYTPFDLYFGVLPLGEIGPNQIFPGRNRININSIKINIKIIFQASIDPKKCGSQMSVKVCKMPSFFINWNKFKNEPLRLVFVYHINITEGGQQIIKDKGINELRVLCHM